MIEQLTIANNPSVEQPENERKQFDYRPYVINWCLSLRVLDGIMVGAKERFVDINIYLYAVYDYHKMRISIIIGLIVVRT